MKYLKINPQNILIQENMENYLDCDKSRLKEYLNEEYKKLVVVTLYKGHLIALDGNKKCTVCRIKGIEVDAILLKCKEAFDNFYKNLSREIYDSPLINFLEWKSFEKTLDFYVEMHKDIEKRDYFFNNLNRNKLYKNCKEDDLKYLGEQLC